MSRVLMSGGRYRRVERLRRVKRREHDPEKACPDLIRGGHRFSDKIMLLWSSSPARGHPLHQQHAREHPAQPGQHVVDHLEQAVGLDHRQLASAIAMSDQIVTSTKSATNR